MTASSSTPTLKILLLGDTCVGKTSLRAQYIHHIFSNSYKETIGADFLSRKQPLDDPLDHEVYLQLWDTAGQERFNSLVKSFYRGTDVAIFIFDVAKPSTFHNLKTWIQQFIENVQVNNPKILIVGNKCDLPTNEHLISVRQCRELLEENYYDQYVENIESDIFYISAKNYIETEDLFKRAAILGFESLQNQRENGNNTMVSFDQVDITEQSNNTSRQGFFGGCC